MGIECKYEDIKNHTDNVCEFVKANCDYTYFNLFSLHYCYLDQNYWLTLPILLLIGFLCFFILSDTSNRYLSNALTLLSDKLKISQNLAGLTFVAFGNGAPDVISSIVASTDDTDGIEFTIGALMGASVFVTSFVLSTVVLYAKSIKVESHLFIRDILMYLLTIGILCLFSYDRKITLWESISYLSIYIIYASIAVVQDKCSSRIIPADISKEIPYEEEDIADEIAHNIEHSNEEIEESRKIQDNEAGINRSLIKSKLLGTRSKGNPNLIFNGSSITYSETNIEDMLRHDHFYENRESRQLGEDLNMSVSMNGKTLKRYEDMINFHFLSMKYRIKKHYFEHKETNWSKKNWANKLFYILIEFPFTLLRDLTIPPVDISRWNRCFVIVMPITVFTFIVIMTSNIDIFLNNLYILISVIVVLLLISFLISRFAYYNKLPDCIVFLCILAFAMSVFWIWCISELLVYILKVTGVIFNIPEAFLGMTILAFDLSVNCSLAKNGFGEMAIAGSIAGPLFNVLVGLGISLVRKNIIRGDIKFFFFDFDKNAIILISFIALTINLIILLIHGVISKFNLKPAVSYIGYFVYLVFCIGIFFFTFR